MCAMFLEKRWFSNWPTKWRRTLALLTFSSTMLQLLLARISSKCPQKKSNEHWLVFHSFSHQLTGATGRESHVLLLDIEGLCSEHDYPRSRPLCFYCFNCRFCFFSFNGRLLGQQIRSGEPHDWSAWRTEKVENQREGYSGN